MSVSNLVSNTIGAATELDRVMGYEANASGTSYLHDPFEMLGSFAIGTSLLSVTGNRREPGGAATVQWDDESVVPEEVPLVTEGRLTDFATSRESATWLRGIYTKHGKSVRSNGCMYAPRGIDAPLIHTPNLVMKPGPETETLESLIQGVSNGLYFRGMSINMDFQQLNGLGRGMCYEIKNGKRVARILNTGVLFRTPELWKNLIALGGETSLRRYGNPLWKGEPSQRSAHSVTAYPAVFKDITVVDVMRKV
jgi:TldD protein